MIISENEALFQMIGTTYGGDGENTFNLPDLRGRTPVWAGNGLGSTVSLGEIGGLEEVTLANAKLLNAVDLNLLFTLTPKIPIGQSNAFTSNLGGSQAHENRQPYVGINYYVSLQGIFPSPN